MHVSAGVRLRAVKRLAAVALLAVVSVPALACRAVTPPSAPDVIEPNDFFVGDDALRDKPVEAFLGAWKRSTEGGAFYAVGDAVDLFTKYAWRSRVPRADELKAGVRVACFLSKASAIGTGGTDLQEAPRTRAEAFTRQWALATLTDPPAGQVVAVAGCRCDAKGVRIVLP